MKNYCRMVIDLYKEALTSVDRVNPEKSMEVLTELAKAISLAKVNGEPADELIQLQADVEQIRTLNE